MTKSVLVLLAVLTASCGDKSTTIGINYTVATVAPEFIAVISAKKDLSSFSQNITFRDLQEAELPPFYEDQTNLKGCAVFTGQVDLSAAGVTSGIAQNCTDLGDSFSPAILPEAGFTEDDLKGLDDPLSAKKSFKLLSTQEGYVFVLFFFNIKDPKGTRTRCFQIFSREIAENKLVTRSGADQTFDERVDFALKDVNDATCYTY